MKTDIPTPIDSQSLERKYLLQELNDLFAFANQLGVKYIISSSVGFFNACVNHLNNVN